MNNRLTLTLTFLLLLLLLSYLPKTNSDLRTITTQPELYQAISSSGTDRLLDGDVASLSPGTYQDNLKYTNWEIYMVFIDRSFERSGRSGRNWRRDFLLWSDADLLVELQWDVWCSLEQY